MRRVTAALLVLVATAACTKGEIEPLPPAPSVPETTTTAVVDLSGVPLPPVNGRTTTTILLGPGTATISGTVVGPEGPVPQAVIRAERLVGDGASGVDILANPDGTYTIPNILGGRYRVRAWRAPDLALTDPEVLFLDGKEKRTLDLKVSTYTGPFVSAAIAPNPPIVDRPAGLTVLVVERSVDASGVVRSVPLPDVSVQLAGSSDWRLASANPQITDAQGRAKWVLTCRRVGKLPLAVNLPDGSRPLEIPDCSAPAPEPVPEGEGDGATSSSTSAPAQSTTTAR